MKNKRNRLNTIVDILTLLKEHKNLKITPLIYKSNLSSRSIKSYILELSSKELISERAINGKKNFIITPKGIKFLEEFSNIKVFAESYGFQDSF